MRIKWRWPSCYYFKRRLLCGLPLIPFGTLSSISKGTELLQSSSLTSVRCSGLAIIGILLNTDFNQVRPRS